MDSKFHKFRKNDPHGYPLRNKSLKDLRGEKWEPIPGYEDSYMVSSLGRIKSLERLIYYANGKIILKKEQIMSPALARAPNYYVRDFKDQIAISLYSNSRPERFSVRRLVYHCFVAPIALRDHTFSIMCKDGNGLNLHYKNLEKVTRTRQQERIFEEERSVTCFSYLDMKAIVQKTLAKRMRQVTQYDLKGKKLNVFPGIKPAAAATGCKRSLISNVLKGRTLKTGGYIFRYGDGPKKLDLTGYWEKGKIASAKKRSLKVTQYSPEGQRIAIYNSLTEAAEKTGASLSVLSSCISGKLNSAKGFVWKRGEGAKKISTKNLMTRDKFFEQGRKKIAQYTTGGSLVAVYDSILKAGMATGIDHTAISAAARGVSQSSGGYRWEFVARKDRQREYKKRNRKAAGKGSSTTGKPKKNR